MRSKKALLIVMIALLILGLIAVGLVIYRLRQMVAELPQTIETQLEAQLDRDVRLGRVRILSLDSAVIEGLEIADGETFEEGIFFSAREVIIRFSLIDILLGRERIARAIGDLTLIDPHIRMVRDPAGVWNFQDLLVRPPVPPEERFRGFVTIRNGQITLTDHAAGIEQLPAVNVLRAVSGSLDFRPVDSFGVDLQGSGEEDRVQAVRVEGRWGIDEPVTELNLAARGANANYWLDYFTEIGTWDIDEGTFNGTAVLSQPVGVLVARGSIELRDASLTSPYLTMPVRNFAANINFVGDNMALSGRGFLNRSPVELSGRVFGFERLDLRVASRRMDFNTLQAAIGPLPSPPEVRWITPGSLTADITGTTTNPIVTGSARVSRGTVFGTIVTRVAARGIYRNGVISITEATGGAAGGDISLTARIDLAPVRIRLSGTGTGVRLAALPIPAEVEAAGIANVNFSLDYLARLRDARIRADVTRGRLAGLRFARGRTDMRFTGPQTAEATVSITQGEVAGAGIQSASAVLSLRGRLIHVRQADVGAFQGSLTARGTMTVDGALSLGVAASAIDLHALLGPFGYENITGTANFQGTLTGTVFNPRLEGMVAARDGTLQDIRYDVLQGRMIATRQALILEDATIRADDIVVVAVGRIVIARDVPVRVDFRVQARQVPLAQLFAILNIPLPVAGVARADLAVRGVFPNLQVEGEIAAVDGHVAQIPFDLAVLRLETVDGRLMIRELFAQREEMRLVGSGFVGPGGTLAINLIGQDLRLGLLNEAVYPYLTLQGPMNLGAQLRGTLANPALLGSITAPEPTINLRQFESFEAGISWDGARFSITDGMLIGPVERYDLAFARITPATAGIDLLATAQTSSIQAVLDVVRGSPIAVLPEGEAVRDFLDEMPEPLEGAASGTVRLAGLPGNLSGGASIAATGIQMGDAPLITRAEMDFIARQDAFMLRRVALTAPGVDFTASAEFVGGLPNAITAQVVETELAPTVEIIRNATFLRLFTFGQTLVDFAEGVPEPVEGVWNANISLSALQTQPTGVLTVNAEDVILGDQEVGDIVADARFAAGTVLLDRLQITPPEGQVYVSGSIDPDGMVALTGQGTQMPLALLQPWLPVTSLTGIMDFAFTASGTTLGPAVTASLTAQDVEINGVSLDLIQSEQITIADSRIATDQLTVQSNGGLIVASGFLPFQWTTPFVPSDQPISVAAEAVNQDLSLAEGLGIVQEARGPITAQVAVTGTIAEPMFDGEISMTDGFLSLEGFANDFTDITFVATFENAVLAVQELSGTSTLGGSFSGSGNIDLEEGLVGLFIDLNSLRVDAEDLVGVGERLLFTATGQLVVSETVSAPSVTGLIVVSDARIIVPPDLVDVAIEPPVDLPIVPDLGITVNLARNVVVERGALSAEVQGPITITGSLVSPVIAGTVQVVDGSYSVPRRTLDILSGGTASVFIQPPLPAVVSVDMTATTMVTALSPLTGAITRFTVFMGISGPLGDLDIDITTIPSGLDELEVLVAIFGGAPLEAVLRGVPLDEIIQEQLAQILLGIVVPGLFDPFIIEGLIFALEPGFDVPLQISVTAALTERVTLTYRRSVVGRFPLDTVSFSYIVTPNLAVTAEFEGPDRSPRDATYFIQYFRRWSRP